MTLRSRYVTSGPGRAPASDGRARHGRGRSRIFSARRPHGGRAGATPTTTASRRRADALFVPEPNAALADVRAARAATARAGPRPDFSAPPDSDSDSDPGLPGATAALNPAPTPSGVTDRDVDDGRSQPSVPEPGELGGRREQVRLAVRERLPLWVQLRCGLEPRTLAALAVVLVVAAVLAAQHFWAARPQPVSAPETVREEAAAPEPAREPSPSPRAAPAALPAGHIVVDVSGKVRSPGVRRLPAGSRVGDAVRAAGGTKPGADLTGLNRARVLVDGEQVAVGGPVPPGQVAAGPQTTAPVGGGTGIAGGQAAPVSLGAATVEQLDTLPGVGPVLARHIIEYRTQHGGFRSVDELREVNGIGERRFADIEPRVRL